MYVSPATSVQLQAQVDLPVDLDMAEATLEEKYGALATRSL